MNKHLRNEIELVSVVVIALALLISPFFLTIKDNPITGFATGIQTQTKKFDIKQIYTENSVIEFNETKITRLTITGNYVGEGTATIYANISGTLLKIHEINTKKTEEKNSLTGYVTFEENETEQITQEIPSEETNIEEAIVEEIIEEQIIEEPLTEQQTPEPEEEIIPIETPREENITPEPEEEIIFEEIVEEQIKETITEEPKVEEVITKETEEIIIQIPINETTNETITEEPKVETPINDTRTEYNETIENNETIELNETIIFENKCVETCNLLDSDITNIIVLVDGLELYIDGLTYIKKIEDFSQIKIIQNITITKNEKIIIDLNEYFVGENIYFDFSSSSGYNYNISENFLEIQGKEIGTWNAVVYAAKNGNVITSNEFNINVNEFINMTTNITKIDEELLERLRNGESIRVIAKTKTKLETIKIPEQEKKGENTQLIAQTQGRKKQLTQKEINMHKGKKILDENTQGIIEIKQETKNTIATEINLEQALELTNLEEIEHIIIDEPFSTLTQETINITKINYVQLMNYSGSGQTICVLDTGVSNSALGTKITGYNFVEDNENINDGHGHGTRVIYSTIQTAPNSEVIAVKVLDDSGNGYSSDIIAGLEYCESQNASIISMSIGGSSSFGYCDSDLVAQKVNELNNAGVLVVVATGNDGSTDSIKIPSCASGALPVGASTKSNSIATFSNYNNATLLVAPGLNVLTKDATGDDVSVSGTSISVPFVSGTAALLLQNKSINPDEIKELLVHTGDLINYSGRYFAQLNAWNALTRNITNNLSEEAVGLSNLTTENYTVSSIDTIMLINPLNTSIIESPVSFTSNISGNGLVNATLYTNETGSWAPIETRWNGEVPWNSTGLVALWHFNNESSKQEDQNRVYDWSGNNLNLTCSACPQFIPNSKFGGSYNYTPSTKHYVNDTPLLTNLRNLTIMAWIRFNSLAADMRSDQSIIRKLHGGGLLDSFNLVQETSGRIYIQMKNTSANSVFATTISKVDVNKWYFVVGRYNGTHVDIFLNGAKETDSTQPLTGAVYDSNSILQIESDNFNGFIDEISIWNKSFTDAEIAALYNYSRTKFYPVFQNRTLSSGTYTWNVLAVDNESNSSWATSNYTFTIAEDPVPNVTLITPTNGNTSVTSPVTFVSNTTDNQEVINATLYTNETGSWAPIETRWNGEVPWNSTGLVALWHFNNESAFGENSTYIYDFAGGDHNNTCTGTACATFDNTGIIGGAYKFDGNDSFTFPVTNLPSGNSNRTMCAWANPASVSSGWHWIISYGTAFTSNAFFIGRNADSLYGGGFENDIYVSSYFKPGQWYHICLIYDGVNATLYGNGAYLTSTAKSWNTILSTGQIGKQVEKYPEYWDGTIDEIAIWNRSLSDAEIAALYNYSRTKFYPVFQNKTLSSGTYTWNVLAIDNQSNSSWATSNYTFTIAKDPVPNVTLITPTNGNTSVTSPVTFVSNTTDNQEVINATLYTNETGSWAPIETRWNGEVPWNSTGLVALWHFNNESSKQEDQNRVYDWSGNNLNLTCSACPQFIPNSKFGGSYNYTPSTKHYVNDTPLLTNLRNLTIMAWIRFNSLAADMSSNQNIIRKLHSEAPWDSFNLVQETSGRIYIQMKNTSGNSVYATTISKVDVNKWYFVVGRYNGTHVDIFLNGAKETNSTQPLTGAVYDSNSILQIESYNFNGSIDEISIWNKSFTDAEIAALYNYSRTKFYPVFQNKTLSSGTYTWNVLAIDNQSNSAWATSNYTFTIQNSPPTQPNTPTMTPTTAYRNTTFTSSLGTGSTDQNNDPITYYYNFVNNTASLQETVLNTFTCNSSDGCKKGTIMRVQIRGYDGIDYGLHSDFSNNVTILNWPPTMPSNLTMAYITYNESITLNCTNSTDPVDNDAIVYIIQSNHTGSWLDIVNGDSDGYYNWAFTGIESSKNYFRCAGNDSDNISSYRNFTNTISIDALPPRLLLNSSNHTTKYGDDVSFSVQWNDINLDACIFEYYNGSAWSNTTNTSCENGQTWTLIKTMTATRGMIINWTWYANDTFGNVNKTRYDYFVIENTPPTLSNVILNATSIQNLTTDNLTLYFSQTDVDTDNIYNVTDWRINGTSIALLNMPFNLNVSNNNSDAVLDYSTYGHYGTLGNGNESRMPTWVSDGKVGGAYRFNESQWDHIKINRNGLELNNSFTITAWYKITNLYNNYLFSIGDYDSLYYKIHETYSYVSGNVHINHASNYPTNTWIFVAIVFSDTNTTLYENATYMNSTPRTGTFTLEDDIYIGGRTGPDGLRVDGSAHFFDGYIDEFIIWNQTLSSDQIQTIYQAGLNKHSVDIIVRKETSTGENWSTCITPSDGYDDGTTICSNGLIIKESALNVNLTKPPTGWFTSINPILECSASSTASIINITLYTNHSGTFQANETNSTVSGTSVNVRFNSTIFPQGNYTWNCYACTSSLCTFDTVNRTFYVDTTNPSISFVAPTPSDGAKQSNTTNYAFINVSSSDDNGEHMTVLDWNRSMRLWLTFDNVSGTTVYDKSTYAENGLFQWDSKTIEGYVGKGVYLDGAGDRVHVDNFMETGNFSEYTLLLWIKLDMLPSEAGNSPVLIRPLSAEYSLTIQSTGDVIYLNTNNGSGNYYVRGETSLQKDTWYHVAAIYNGTYAQIYLNGVPDDSSPVYASGPLPHIEGILQIGGSGGPNFNGTIDEVHIYSRALTPQEINASYNANLFKYYNNFTNLQGGNYSYTAYAVDRAGNTNQTSRSFIINRIPEVSNVKLNATTSFNYSSDNLTLYFTQSDADGDEVYNVTDWRINGTSIALLNMPFNINVSTTTTGAVKDYSTYGNNGTLASSTATPIWTSSGKIGGAYNFDGIDDYIDTNTDLSWNITDSFSISAWVKNTVAGSNYNSIVSKINYEYIFYTRNNNIGFNYWNSTGSDTITMQGSVSDITEWHFAVVTYNGSVGKLYIDGILSSTDSVVSGTLQNRAETTKIGTGYSWGTPSGSFNGTIDEVQIFNRSLSAEQIYAIYQAGLANHSVNTIVRNETIDGENWSTCVTASDKIQDSATVCSNNVTIQNGVPTIISSTIYPSTAYTNDTLRGYCNATDADDATIYYHYQWFLDGVPNVTGTIGPYSESININIANISSSSTTKGQEWILQCIADDTTSNSSALNSTTLTILNHPPEQVNLIEPSNGNDTITNRTISYNWSDSSDIDNDYINYSIEVSLNRTFQANMILNKTGILDSNFTDYVERDSATYYWRVRAFDGTNYSEWSETFNYTLEDYLLVTLTNNVIDFGTLGLGSVQNTTDNTPNPFEFMNKGNVYADLLNITVNKSMWISEPLNTSYSQFKIRNETPFSINQSSSNYSWLYLNNYSNQIIANYFNWRTNNNTLKVDMHIEVPSIEPPGIKNTTITFTWVQS